MQSRTLGTFESELDNHSQLRVSLPVRRTLLRREADFTLKLADQLSRGRPSADWSMCGDEGCQRCAYKDKMFLSARNETFVNETASKRTSFAVAPRFDIYVEGMVQDLFRKKKGGRGYEELCFQVRAFTDSPPVRCAVSEFRAGLFIAGLEPTAKDLAITLTALHPKITHIVESTRLHEATLPISGCDKDDDVTRNMDIHTCSQPSDINHRRPREWGLDEYALEFCLYVESWRRHAHGRLGGIDWAFGGRRRRRQEQPQSQMAETRATFLSCVLLNEWDMWQQGQMHEVQNTKIHMTTVWDEWLNSHVCWDKEGQGSEGQENDHRSRLERRAKTEGEKEEESMEGLGRQMTPWKSERMRELGSSPTSETDRAAVDI